jgi:hypothetical protein
MGYALTKPGSPRARASIETFTSWVNWFPRPVVFAVNKPKPIKKNRPIYSIIKQEGFYEDAFR